MAPGGRDRGERRRGTALLLAASARLYGALLALYPKAFRAATRLAEVCNTKQRPSNHKTHCFGDVSVGK